MEQTIAFIRDVLGHSGDQCCADQGGGGGGEACATKQTNLAAVVGPGKSSTSIAVQNLLQVFRMPQIGYSATSTDLTNKEEFGYYLRVVPSDVWQARAMLEIVKRFGWTYIAVVYSAGNYGEKGFEELQHFIEGEKNICIAISEKIKSLAEPKAFDALLTTIAHTHPRPQVAICFCEGQTIRSIFQAVKRSQNSQNRNANDTSRLFQWIGSDAWADRQDVVEHVEEEAAGSFSMRIHSPKV
uniref:Receptor ligand binding region domain-containing protein n=1 Tax=Plectus sambesii TaxID=2011161 RepID=A0A914V1A1_9BILA